MATLPLKPLITTCLSAISATYLTPNVMASLAISLEWLKETNQIALFSAGGIIAHCEAWYDSDITHCHALAGAAFGIT